MKVGHCIRVSVDVNPNVATVTQHTVVVSLDVLPGIPSGVNMTITAVRQDMASVVCVADWRQRTARARRTRIAQASWMVAVHAAVHTGAGVKVMGASARFVTGNV